jgi:hypothetical protein
MKVVVISVIVIALVFIISQGFISRSTSQTEKHKYTVLKDFEHFEIRKYEPALFSYVVMPEGNYQANSGRGFRDLAGYIFGGNEKKQQIAMTSPVTMTMDDDFVMKFMIPQGMTLEDMPAPNNSRVQFSEEPEKIVAAISFGGWANDARIAEYRDKLKKLLDEQNIKHKGKFSYLGYNPPYEVSNRRNEVVVEVEY